MGTDVAQSTKVEQLVEATVAQFGKLDRAFNNADTAPRGGPVAEMNEADWGLTTAFDFKGVDCG